MSRKKASPELYFSDLDTKIKEAQTPLNGKLVAKIDEEQSSGCANQKAKER
jgi:hypothetical protein